ncbi:MAG TPA: MFS transporter [Clostridiales bacterium]|nr:MAG: Inner membrane symporter YihP [Firmicutes bacterium ADurb.Bin262]HOU09295.1 MFS transporter [Clostridiales bacterium]HQK73433.1 MFS transporter [Clostridiales bacterium]
MEQTAKAAEEKTGAHEPEERKYQNRLYVGHKETVGYVLNHWAGGFNVYKFRNRFIYDVLFINFNFLAILDAVGGIWDVINDTIIGVIVDKTRTRWGKFRPYLIGLQIPMTFLSAFYWFMPFIFAGTSDTDLTKFAVYFAFNVITETAGTFTGISATGLLSTITPNPLERTMLITKGQLLAIGSNVPELLMGLLLDLVNNKILGWKLRNLFLGFGLFTNFAAAGACFYYFLHCRERVMQSIERPSILQGLKSILTNKPILLITLSDFLEGFSMHLSMTDYYIDVLGSATLQTIVGIPGGIFTYSGYAAVKPLRKRFSTRFLWIFQDLWNDMCWLGVCGIGIINGNFMKRKVMIPTIMIEECIEMCMYAVGKVIPPELYNEAMDYCEWKNGYRTEAMTGVARGLITKLQRIVNNVVKNLLMSKIGYQQGRAIGTQDYKTKFWLFVFSTGLPVITGSLGVLPKFFYPLTGKKRDQMYEELIARREQIASAVTNATAEELAELGRKQITGDFEHLTDKK